MIMATLTPMILNRHSSSWNNNSLIHPSIRLTAMHCLCPHLGRDIGIVHNVVALFTLIRFEFYGLLIFQCNNRIEIIELEVWANHDCASPNSEKLLYLKPGTFNFALSIMPCLYDLENEPTTEFLNCERIDFPNLLPDS